jgi:formylglycine-generating enzyme required for sulfatase activity
MIGFTRFAKFAAVAVVALAGLMVSACGTSNKYWVSVPGGTFMMGSNNGEGGKKQKSCEAPAHQVRVKAFKMARTEVTVAEYGRCVKAGACTAPHWDDGTCYFWDGKSWTQGVVPQFFKVDDKPVVCIDWDQAAAYAKWVGGRLPTEAEWEYAARAGTTDEQHGDIDAIAWYEKTSGGQTQQVAQMRPNAFGLHDMLGNVWEWCQDWFHDSYDGAPADGVAWENPESTWRVYRGGSWGFDAKNVRAGVRFSNAPAFSFVSLGLRPVK